MTREQVTLILLSLEEELPQMRQQLSDESDFQSWFARQADYLLVGVGPDHYEFAQARLHWLLGVPAAVPSESPRN